MAIIETISNEYALWEALQKTNGYKNNFTIEGAKALQTYLDDWSESIDENIEFDPIAWCCEFSEYKNLKDYNKQHNTKYKTLDELSDNTEVIEFNGGVIVRDF